MIDVVERLADGSATMEESWEAYDDATSAYSEAMEAEMNAARAEGREPTGHSICVHCAAIGAGDIQGNRNDDLFLRDVLENVVLAAGAYFPGPDAEETERQFQSHLVRDMTGNPFQVVTLDPSWLTSNVVPLAQAIYEERSFADLPVLADALEEAGCTNTHILAHCRLPREHVRGCWAVDLLLGKS
jgi:hypothetical protein